MRLTFEALIDVPLDRVAAFHEKPLNLARLMEGWSSFRLLDHAGHVRAGATMRLEERMAGLLPVRMTLRHATYEPPHRYGEVMTAGPFRRFEHLHEFAADGESTRMRETLIVELPWWLGGRLADPWIARRIRQEFEHRRRRFRELLAAE